MPTHETLERDAFGERPWVELLVAEGAEGLIGHAALCPLIKLQNRRRGVDLHHLVVAPAHRGQEWDTGSSPAVSSGRKRCKAAT